MINNLKKAEKKYNLKKEKRKYERE